MVNRTTSSERKREWGTKIMRQSPSRERIIRHVSRTRGTLLLVPPLRTRRRYSGWVPLPLQRPPNFLNPFLRFATVFSLCRLCLFEPANFSATGMTWSCVWKDLVVIVDVSNGIFQLWGTGTDMQNIFSTFIYALFNSFHNVSLMKI